MHQAEVSLLKNYMFQTFYTYSSGICKSYPEIFQGKSVMIHQHL